MSGKLKWCKPAWSENFSWWLFWEDGTRMHMGYTLAEAIIEKVNLYGAEQKGTE